MVDFLNKNVEKIVIKGPKLCKKVKVYALNYNFTEFLLLNTIVDQIFSKIYKILENLVTSTFASPFWQHTPVFSSEIDAL